MITIQDAPTRVAITAGRLGGGSVLLIPLACLDKGVEILYILGAILYSIVVVANGAV
jgi:hypothetical protein